CSAEIFALVATTLWLITRSPTTETNTVTVARCSPVKSGDHDVSLAFVHGSAESLRIVAILVSVDGLMLVGAVVVTTTSASRSVSGANFAASSVNVIRFWLDRRPRM